MRVAILGPVEAGPGAVGGTRLRQLLVRLALAAGRAVTLEELAEALWPEGRPADPANALQSLVSRLRRVLPEPGALVSVPGGYLLRAATDVAEFEQLVRRAATSGAPAARVELLSQALALWRGPALGEVAAAPFAVGYATRLEESRLSAVEDLAEAELALAEDPAPPPGADRSGLGDSGVVRLGAPGGSGVDRLGALVAELGELAVRHPLRERLHGLRVRALHAAGRTAEALAAYEQLRRALADELGTDPGPELRALHLRLLRAEPAPRPRTNLRAPLTSFVGRTAEIDRIVAQLRDSRLVTLVGPGGAGKTRLATTVAALLHDPAGPAVATAPAVWVVELAAVRDPGDLPQAVLGALGALSMLHGPGAPRDTLGRLAEALSGGPVLLLLDNCEHLIEAAARLAEELLGRCRELRVLATSREPLAVSGEALSPVGPLPLELAVQLFHERAAAVRPDFAPTEQVAEICRRLDGLPLAIELAAARLRALTLPQVADRLDDRFALLSGGSRTALPRHQTLRAVVAWSWDLAEEAERSLAERLAVFPGSFDAEAAERFGGGLDALAALVDKSLLQQAPGGRFRMLETIREYALERLGDSGQAAAVRAAHAAHFLRLAETAEPYLRSREQLVWIHRLVAEHDNLLAALHFAVGAGDADTAVRLVAALAQFWTLWGNPAESVTWMGLALEVRGPAPGRERTVATAAYLINRAFSGGFADAREPVERLRALIAESDLDDGHPLLALIEPALALFTDDEALGLAAIERGLNHSDPWTRAIMRYARGALKENQGDMAGMRADLSAAESELAALGERWGLSQTLTMLGIAHTLHGDYPAAIAALETAILLIRELDPGDPAGHQQVGLARARVLNGDVEAGRARLEALANSASHGWLARDVAFAQLELGDLARRAGDLAEAGRMYTLAAATMEGLPVVAPQFRALILAQRAHLEAGLGRVGVAAGWVGTAVELALRVKDMPVLATVGVAAAAVWAARGEFETAARVLGASEQLRGLPDSFSPDIAVLAGRLRAALGEAAYDRAYAAGRALARADAVAQVRAL